MTANFVTKELTIKQLGANSSSVAGKQLARNESSILGQMGKFELVPDKYKYHVHFGQRVPETVLEKLRQDADDHNSISDSEGIAEGGPSNCSLHGSGKKRTRDGNDVLENRIMCDGDQEIAPPAKKSRLDQPKAQVHQDSNGGVSKPQQMSLTAFYKPKLSSSNDSDSGASAKLMTPQWEEKGSMLIMRFGEPVASSKVASYDLDGTLIETASGRKFATSASDWKLLPKTADKLHCLHRDDYKIVIITNQLGISRGKPTVVEFKQKVEAIARALKVPLLLLAATSKDKYRKPCLGMWEHMSVL